MQITDTSKKVGASLSSLIRRPNGAREGEPSCRIIWIVVKVELVVSLARQLRTPVGNQ